MITPEVRANADQYRPRFTRAQFTELVRVRCVHPRLAPGREALALIIKSFSESKGIPATVLEVLEVASGQTLYSVMVETNKLGAAAILRKTGWRVSDLVARCEGLGVSFRDVFPWAYSEARGWERINPCVWPVNTPDVYEVARQLIH